MVARSTRSRPFTLSTPHIAAYIRHLFFVGPLVGLLWGFLHGIEEVASEAFRRHFQGVCTCGRDVCVCVCSTRGQRFTQLMCARFMLACACIGTRSDCGGIT